MNPRTLVLEVLLSKVKIWPERPRVQEGAKQGKKGSIVVKRDVGNACSQLCP
jgi:hypothetical protein